MEQHSGICFAFKYFSNRKKEKQREKEEREKEKGEERKKEQREVGEAMWQN